MSNSTIGIKIADGSYYPILEENTVSKKRLVLTTVNDSQQTVQIDLYKGTGEEIKDAVYIGSLVIENIKEATKGDPEIELIIGVDEEGSLTATAGDLSTGEHQSLSVGLESLDEDGTYEIPDFELDSKYEPDETVVQDMETNFTTVEDGTTNAASEEKEEQPKKNPWLFVGFLAASLVILLLFILLMVKLFSNSDNSDLSSKGKDKTQIEKVEPEKKIVKEKKKEPVEKVVKKKEVKKKKKAVVVPEKEKISTKGQWYRIKNGDTLWDISVSVYHDPLRFKKIAEKNNIMNPDLIFAGDKIFISE